MDISKNRSLFIEDRLEVYEFESMFSYIVYHWGDYTVVSRIALNANYEPDPACEDLSVIRHFYPYAHKDSDRLDWQEWIKADEQARREWIEEQLSETVDEVFAS